MALTQKQLENKARIIAMARARGINPDFAVRVAEIESNLGTNNYAKGSSAQGPYQFTNKTWEALKKQGLAKGSRHNLEDAFDAFANLTEQNRRAITATAKAMGMDPNDEGLLYMAHQWGPDRVKRALRGDKSQPVSTLFMTTKDRDGTKTAANNGMTGMTIEQAMEKWNNKVKGVPTNGTKQNPTALASSGQTSAPTPTEVPLQPSQSLNGALSPWGERETAFRNVANKLSFTNPMGAPMEEVEGFVNDKVMPMLATSYKDQLLGVGAGGGADLLNKTKAQVMSGFGDMINSGRTLGGNNG